MSLRATVRSEAISMRFSLFSVNRLPRQLKLTLLPRNDVEWLWHFNKTFKDAVRPRNDGILLQQRQHNVWICVYLS